MSDEVVFWKKRAKEYEDIILRLVTEQVNTKFDSIEITGKHIIFKNSQPERKKGKWIDETFKPWGLVYHPYKCDQCGEHSEADSNFCPNCGADMRGEQDG